uniref:Uncharacterized protein n=1 Tax=Gossypium raimondii TaxID=29730 RepID=A0A0D2RKM5_GOSRA|nr:hypothetical protein B456_011G112300 [Gossypium raimondii]
MNSEKTMNNDIPSLTFQAHRVYSSIEGKPMNHNQLQFSGFKENMVYLYPCMKKIENPIMTSLFSYHYPPSNSVVCCQLLPLLEVTVELNSYFRGGPIVARTWI